ncbi:MAG TPA: bile acid:sodium symporter family protein [Bacteroidia bacterium]|nr:bile acid:sodium symporter family protein [Bacteroidia bacterium]
MDWFLPSLAAVILLARFFPETGVQTGFFSLTEISGYGITLIFFFYGLRQDPKKFADGLRNWRMHLVIQSATFVLFPVIALLIRPLFDSVGSSATWTGIFYLCVLPSTVSTSVVMVSIAGGNIPAAIFNASLSGIAGVFVTPMWMSFILKNAGGEIETSGIIFKLMVQILMPVVLGMLLHSRLGNFAERHKKKLRLFDQLVILAIVYTAFSHSFAKDAFAGFGMNQLLMLGAGMAALFFLVFGTLYSFSKISGFPEADAKTVIFCGSKKSLVHGSVMASVFFQHASTAGMILLPLMLYHTLQIVFASTIAGRMKQATTVSSI